MDQVAKGVMKQKVYPTIIGLVGTGLILLVIGRWGMMSWGNLTSSDPSISVPATPTPTPANPEPPTAIAPISPLPSIAPSPIAPPTPVASPVTPPAAATVEGRFRVSNQTDHPIRIALLSGTESSEPSDAPPVAAPLPDADLYQEPVHWDFAPQEGSAKGLILSLPDGSLQLQDGDIVVAFAQDGSRRYWGPFVVGKTADPLWNAEAREWQLILSP